MSMSTKKKKKKKKKRQSADSSQRTYTGDPSNETVSHYGPDLHFPDD